MIPMSITPSDIGNDGRGVAAPGCRVRQFSHRDSLRALSGIRLPTRSAIVAGPITGKVSSMERHEQTYAEGAIGTQQERQARDATITNTLLSREDARIRRRVIEQRKYKTEGIAKAVAKRLARTHCHKGHEFTSETTFINPRGNRECRICRRMAGTKHKNSIPSAAKARAFIEGLREGRTISDLTHGYAYKDGVRVQQYGRIIICGGQVAALKASNRSIGRLIDRLAKKNARENQSKWGRIGAQRKLAKIHGASGPNDEKVYSAIITATADLPDFLRDDVRQSMFVAAWEGDLKPCDAAKRVREFVTAHYRQNSKFVPGGGIMRSLDEQVYDEGPTRLVDTITHGLWQ